MATAAFTRIDGRRRRVGFAVSLALAMLVLLLVGRAFVEPNRASTKVPVLTLAELAVRRPVHVWVLPATGAWVVRLEREVVAFSDRDPRTGCALSWLDPAHVQRLFRRPTYSAGTPEGIFRDGYSGSWYAVDGGLVFGPTNRDLTRYAVGVEMGTVSIDVGRITPGAAHPESGDSSTPTPANRPG